MRRLLERGGAAGGRAGAASCPSSSRTAGSRRERALARPRPRGGGVAPASRSAFVDIDLAAYRLSQEPLVLRRDRGAESLRRRARRPRAPCCWPRAAMSFSGNFSESRRRRVPDEPRLGASTSRARAARIRSARSPRLAMMLRESFGLAREAAWIEAAVEEVLRLGFRTFDVAEPGATIVGTAELGRRIAAEVERRPSGAKQARRAEEMRPLSPPRRSAERLSRRGGARAPGGGGRAQRGAPARGSARERGVPVVHAVTSVDPAADDRMPHWKARRRWQLRARHAGPCRAAGARARAPASRSSRRRSSPPSPRRSSARARGRRRHADRRGRAPARLRPRDRPRRVRARPRGLGRRGRRRQRRSAPRGGDAPLPRRPRGAICAGRGAPRPGRRRRRSSSGRRAIRRRGGACRRPRRGGPERTGARLAPEERARPADRPRGAARGRGARRSRGSSRPTSASP